MSPDHEPSRREFGRTVATATLAALTGDISAHSRKVFAQEGGGAKVAEAEHPKQWSLWIRSRWAQIHVCLGQIQATRIHSSQSRTVTSEKQGKGLCETLQVSGDTDIPTVRYGATDETKDINIAVIDGNQVDLTQTPSDPKIPPISFHQHPQGKMLFRIGRGESQQKYFATNIWHLLLREPEICHQHLIPLLDRFVANHHLMENAEQMEEGLRERAGRPHISREDLRRLVMHMGNEDYDVRSNAMNRLYELGLTALPFLESVGTTTLDRDQSERVRSLIQTIKERYMKNPDIGSQEDTVERAVLWLFEDPETWSIFLQRADPKLQAIALQELQAMFPGKTEQELMRKYGKR